MRPVTRPTPLSVLVAAALLAVACGDPAGPADTPAPRATPSVAFAGTVSNPVSSGGPTSALSSVSEAFVSLGPGTMPGATGVTISNLRTGQNTTTSITDGGFDPVAVPATAGDTFELRIAIPDGALAYAKAGVPARRQPRLVRIQPTAGRTDVALNTNIILVFSEPVDRTTLAGGFRLLHDGVAVAGTFGPVQGSDVGVAFEPAAPLAPGTEYQLLVTGAVRDLSGDGLEAAVASSFTTAAAGTLPSPEAPPALPDDPPDLSIGIFVAGADGANPVFLAAGARPAWSPDGLRVAYARQGWIFVIRADGGAETMLAPGWEPAWSPDGGRIAFTSPEGIGVMASDGTGATTLIRHGFLGLPAEEDQGVGRPDWSPDGNRIAFEHHGGSDRLPAQAYVMNADGSGIYRLTLGSARFAESDPAWSPDGSEIALWSYGFGIARVGSTGGEPATVFQQEGMVVYGSRPAWSPDGSAILFVAGRLGPEPAIWRVPRDGGTPEVVIGDAIDPAWSPDGSRIAFSRYNP
jgi:hypothetical protein